MHRKEKRNAGYGISGNGVGDRSSRNGQKATTSTETSRICD